MSKSRSIEISLVPEVKAKLLRQEKIRNLVVFACIVTMIGCGVIVAGLISINAARKLKSNSLDTEISCRIEDEKSSKCKTGKVAIMNTANLNEMLSIQNELNSIGSLNSNKSKPSRLLPTSEQLLNEASNVNSMQVFSMLEIALPSDAEYKFQTSELSIDFDSSVMNYDVVARAEKSKAQATAYQNYKSSINGSYFDYGDYMLTDKDGGVQAIPTYCISDEKIINGDVYGVYRRYAAGCEAPMIDKIQSDDEKDENQDDTKEEPQVVHEVTELLIRRTYKNSDDFEAYKKGENRSKKAEVISAGNEAPTGFYFESACIAYDENGKKDEDATRTNCPIATEEVEGTNKSEGRNDANQKVFTFSVTIPFSDKIFSSSSHNVLFFYPSRKTVSTSYKAIEDFFTNPVEDAKPVEEK